MTSTNTRFAIVTAQFNEPVTTRLLEGAKATFARHGVADELVESLFVPGAFELPLACRWLADTGRFAAVVALGAVIRGGTAHYEHVCTQAARGLMDVSLATRIPVIFGVLTCETLELAMERAGGSAGNKGVDAALAAIAMAKLGRSLAVR